jgi:hypothetical protein
MSSYEGKECHSGWKPEKFEKHLKKMKASQNIANLDNKERKFYVNKKCNCAKNEVTFSQQNHISIAKQVIHVSLKGEKRKKRQQFTTILQIIL